jgi:hypothetical protein
VELEERRRREPLRQRRYLEEEPEPEPRRAWSEEPRRDPLLEERRREPLREERRSERMVDGRRSGGWNGNRSEEQPIDVDPERFDDDPW